MKYRREKNYNTGYRVKRTIRYNTVYRDNDTPFWAIFTAKGTPIADYLNHWAAHRKPF